MEYNYLIAQQRGGSSHMIILGSVNVRHLLLELARHHDAGAILKLAVDTLAASTNVAMARVWLVEEGGDCTKCHDSAICTERAKCLHLRASAGKSVNSNNTWNKVEGSSFARFPMGVRKVGMIAESGKAIEVIDVDSKMPWVAAPEWIKQEKIISFAGQPLVYRDEVLGVLAVFSRFPLEQHALELLRMVADHLANALANARAFELIEKLKTQAEAENSLLREEINEAVHFEGIIGKSAAIENIRSLVRMVAPTEANVLISGESGTGKEMIAREIHRQSPRKDRPMIKINCAAIPRELFESEFFGHARGAFTGAVKSRAGYFEAANGGTLFLDEIGEMPLDMQSKLLRVIQEGEYQRVGEEKGHKVDVRIITATNRNLLNDTKSGVFREDLYYRLQVFPVQMPSLRERKTDITLLATHFATLSGKRLNKPAVTFTAQQLAMLEEYNWPGNIRELQNIIERITITGLPELVLSEITQTISAKSDLTPATTQNNAHINGSIKNAQSEQLYKQNIHAKHEQLPYRAEQILTEAQMRELEKNNLQNALRRTNHIVYGPRGAAKLLGINPTTLISRLKKLGIYSKD